MEALLHAPDPSTPLGLRDRAMLELMYASGLRVSSWSRSRPFTWAWLWRAAHHGQGRQGWLVPFGDEARRWLERYLLEARGAILGGQQTDDLFVTQRGSAMSRVMFWIIVKNRAQWPASPRRCHRTHCATPSPPIC